MLTKQDSKIERTLYSLSRSGFHHLLRVTAVENFFNIFYPRGKRLTVKTVGPYSIKLRDCNE